MSNLSNIGRIFYGVAIAALGLLTIYYRDFAYFFIPPNRGWLSHHVALIYLSGGLLFLAGACIVLEWKRAVVSCLLGTALLLIFCFCFIPYELLVSPHVRQLGDWENSAKELALAGGAFLLAGRRKIIRAGAIIFALTILSFGINHFVYAREAADYIPSWIPAHLFWMYPTGAVLIITSLGILFRIKPRLMAIVMGTMIFIWVIILHTPKCLAAPLADNAGEVTSGLLALAYCGIAFVIAGREEAR